MKGLMASVLLLLGQLSAAQTDTLLSEPRIVVISNVLIEGNTRTKPDIILREMKLKTRDSLSYLALQTQLKIDRENIFNTTLFNTVEISIIDLNKNEVELKVKVSERWYTFPTPILELVDRNFNDWWQNQNHDLSRINYGIFLYQKNVRGRNETVLLVLQGGYTKQLGIKYMMPYLDKAQKNGLDLEFSYSENNNIAYKTEDHYRLFVDRDFPVFSSINAEMNYTFRNTYDTYHSIELNYDNNKVDQLVLDMNPDFFANNSNRQVYFSLGYNFRYDKRDVVAYPQNGYLFDISVRKKGLGFYKDVDLVFAYTRLSKFFNLGKGFFLDNHTAFYQNFFRKISYNNFGGLGYNYNLIRGYELYIIEGDRFFLNKTSFKKLIFSTEKSISWIPLEQFQHFPLQILLKTYFDIGYVNNFDDYEENSTLSNRWNYGTGVGFDVVTAYDIVIRFEYSINDRKEKGLFFHLKKEF